jgi:hypothetical protein
VIASLPHDRQHYAEIQVRDLAHRTGVSEQVIRDLAAKLRAEEVEHAARRPAPARADGEPQGSPPSAPRPCPSLERHALACLMALPDLIAEAREAYPVEDFEDARAREIAAALYGGRPVAEAASDEARELASEIATALDGAKDYAADWEGVKARRAQLRSQFACGDALREGCTDEALRALYEKNLRLKAARGARPA